MRKPAKSTLVAGGPRNPICASCRSRVRTSPTRLSVPATGGVVLNGPAPPGNVTFPIGTMTVTSGQRVNIGATGWDDSRASARSDTDDRSPIRGEPGYAAGRGSHRGPACTHHRRKGRCVPFTGGRGYPGAVSPPSDANVGATASWGAADQCLSQASRAAFLRRTTREKAAAQPQLGALVARCLGHAGSVWTAELATPFAAPSPTCG